MKTYLLLLCFTCTAVVLLTSCSSYDASEYFCLSPTTNINARVFDGFNWVTSSREYSVGRYRPPLYRIDVSDGYLIIYPIRTKYRGFVGPVLLPIFPVPRGLSVPATNNTLEVFLSRDDIPFSIEKISGMAVDQTEVQKTEVPFGIQMEFALAEIHVRGAEISAEIIVGDKRLTLPYLKGKYRHYIPLLVP